MSADDPAGRVREALRTLRIGERGALRKSDELRARVAQEDSADRLRLLLHAEYMLGRSTAFGEAVETVREAAGLDRRLRRRGDGRDLGPAMLALIEEASRFTISDYGRRPGVARAWAALKRRMRRLIRRVRP